MLMKHSIYMAALGLLLLGACAKDVHQEAGDNGNLQSLVVKGI